MTYQDDDNGELPPLTNRQVLDILMQEIKDVRREIREETASMIKNLSNEIKDMRKEMRGMSVKMDRNHIAFMTNIDDHDQRITRLETAAI